MIPSSFEGAGTVAHGSRHLEVLGVAGDERYICLDGGYPLFSLIMRLREPEPSLGNPVAGRIIEDESSKLLGGRAV